MATRIDNIRARANAGIVQADLEIITINCGTTGTLVDAVAETASLGLTATGHMPAAVDLANTLETVLRIIRAFAARAT
ncbi:MAG: hypothetical protein AB7G88_06525 [Thermomicrobiales bacterium]